MSSGIRRGRAAPTGDNPLLMLNLGTVPIDPRPRRFPEHFDSSYRHGLTRYPIENAINANESALSFFRGDTWLTIDELVVRIHEHTEAAFCRRGAYYRWTLDTRHPWVEAGSHVRTWTEYGLVVEEPGPNGERGWRLLSRDMAYAEEGKGRDRHVIRVRGLPPDEQAARYALEERRARTAARFDEKARHRRQPEIDHRVAEMLTYDPDFVVPETWARHGFVDQALVGTRLDVAADVVRGAHHLGGLNRERLNTWILVLWQSAVDAAGVKRPATIELPDADGDALESLVL